MRKYPGRGPRFLTLGIVLLAVAAVGCSDDDPVTEPVEIPDPMSSVAQVNAQSDGTAFAAGWEGDTGRLYFNHTGSWTLYGNQPDVDAITGVLEVQALMDPPGTSLYVFAQPGGIFKLVEGRWAAQSPAANLTSAFLKETASGLWCLGSGGILAREVMGQWNTVLNTDEADSYLTDVTEADDGTVFVSQAFLDRNDGRVHRISLDEGIVADEFDTPITSLAATQTDTVWAGGTRLFCFAQAAWDTVVSISEGNKVVAIGQPEDGSLTLVCDTGLIFRWRDGALTTVQEYKLLGSLASVCYVDETNILGSLNFTDDNTGHETGIIVQFDGMQWITVFLAPPS